MNARFAVHNCLTKLRCKDTRKEHSLNSHHMLHQYIKKVFFIITFYSLPCKPRVKASKPQGD